MTTRQHQRENAMAEQSAWALVTVWKDGREDYYLPGIRRTRRELITLATEELFNGVYDWPSLRKLGWRARRIKIRGVRP